MLICNEKIFAQGDDYFKKLLFDIDQAKISVDFSTYIFAKDKIGQQFVDALIRAANRRVIVNVVLDGWGARHFPNQWDRALTQAGVLLKIHHQLPWRLALKDWRPWLFFRGINRLNHRNHCKYCIIDSSIVWIGSFNITKDHLPLNQKGANWHDLAVRIVNHTELPTLQTLTRQIMFNKEKPKLSKLKLANFRFGYDTRSKKALYSQLIKNLKTAKQHIYLSNPYFVPTFKMIATLKKTAHRNVSIKLLLSRQSDAPLVRWAAYAYYQELIEAGVQIYEYTDSFLHAKYAIIDDWFIVGSSNLSHRSFYHNLELDAILLTDNGKQQLARQFELDLTRAQLVELPLDKVFPWWKKLISRLVFLFHYWM